MEVDKICFARRKKGEHFGQLLCKTNQEKLVDLIAETQLDEEVQSFIQWINKDAKQYKYF